MDIDLFFQQLCELDLQQGRELLEAQLALITNPAAFGVALSDEALRQLYINPATSLKLAELLIFFGDTVPLLSSHALGLKAKGDALRVLGLHQAAIDALDEAGSEFLQLEDRGNWARSRITWITACTWLGDADKALREAARAREVFVQLGEQYWVFMVDNNVAVIYSQIGRYQDAIDLCKKMITVYPTLKDQGLAVLQRGIAGAEANQGEFLSWLGQFEHARVLLLQALERFREIKETSLITYVDLRLADIDLTQGYYGSALQRYHEASARLQQEKIDDPLLQTELGVKMASCLVKLNRTQEACRLAAKATQVLRKRDISLDTANTLREYAHILVASGRLQEAVGILDEAQILFTHAKFARSAFSTRLEQAELSLELASPDEAYLHARAAREYFASRGLVERSLHACLTMAQARVLSLQQASECENGDGNSDLLIAEATNLCKQAIRQASQHGLREGAYRGYGLLGQLAMLQGQTSRARRYHKMAITQIEEMLENLAYDLSPAFLHTVWPLYEHAVYLSLQEQHVAQALNYLERARSHALRHYLQRSQAQPSLEQGIDAGLPPSTEGVSILRLQQELKEWQENYRHYTSLLANQEALTTFALDRATIEHEIARCETKIEELFDLIAVYETQSLPISHPGQQTSPLLQAVETAELQRCLGANQALLAYFLYQEKLLIFVLSNDQVNVYEDPRGRAELERLLPFLYAYLEPESWPNVQQPPQQGIQQLLKKLYNLLLAPIEARLARSTTHLTVVPYGLLHKLPFHALYDGSQHLIDRFVINYLPASHLQAYFSQSQQEIMSAEDGQNTDSEHLPVEHEQGNDGEHRCYTSREEDARSGQRPMVGGVPLVFGYSGQGALQYCLDEAQTVAELLGGRCYLEQEATIANLIRQTALSPVVHIATHGHMRLDAPNFSSILLADGQLNAIDAFQLPLHGCELVTLSGCETGISLSGGGDEQLGLGRAFLAAGARSLLLSLWPVEDRATCELMRIFYEHLLRGANKMQALRAAQRSFLQSATYSHPYFWAAFRLVGDPRPLLFSPSGNISQKREPFTSLEETREISFASRGKKLKNSILQMSLDPLLE